MKIKLVLQKKIDIKTLTKIIINGSPVAITFVFTDSIIQEVEWFKVLIFTKNSV